ncbi:MAG: hypothetical protein WDO24_21625 [Pseudomonadota bacterium]
MHGKPGARDDVEIQWENAEHHREPRVRPSEWRPTFERGVDAGADGETVIRDAALEIVQIPIAPAAFRRHADAGDMLVDQIRDRADADMPGSGAAAPQQARSQGLRDPARRIAERCRIVRAQRIIRPHAEAGDRLLLRIEHRRGNDDTALLRSKHRVAAIAGLPQVRFDGRAVRQFGSVGEDGPLMATRQERQNGASLGARGNRHADTQGI